MGYYIFSYGIKTAQIQQVFGAKNAAFQQKVEDNKTYQHYASGDGDGIQTTTQKALVDMIQGYSYDKTAGYAYGYALIALCSTFGESLPYTNDIKLSYETDAINKVLAEDFGIKDAEIEITLLPDHPFVLPEIADWPIIGLIKHSELLQFKKEFAAVQITDEMIAELGAHPDEKEFTYESLQGIMANINFCIDNGFYLISFCH